MEKICYYMWYLPPDFPKFYFTFVRTLINTKDEDVRRCNETSVGNQVALILMAFQGRH
jgi:hypothetical protein